MFWDRFDIVEAYYAYYTENHSGQCSIGYARICHILEYFKPSVLFNGYDSLEENGKVIYDNLVLENKPA